MSWRYRWQMGDPAKVYESIEAARQNRESRKREATVGAEIKNIHREQLRAMFQWGDWANRAQLWADLRVTPFCKLVGIGTGRPVADVRLDPQSLAIHKAVMRREPRTQAVLYAYYVANMNWDQIAAKIERVAEMGLSRRTFYRELQTGTKLCCAGASLDGAEAERAKIVGTKSPVFM